MLAHGPGASVGHTFELPFFVAAVAPWLGGVGTKERALGEINQAKLA